MFMFVSLCVETSFYVIWCGCYNSSHEFEFYLPGASPGSTVNSEEINIKFKTSEISCAYFSYTMVRLGANFHARSNM